MNDIESRLTDAMAARAREVEPHDEDDALNRISERVTMSHRRTFTILGIAAAVAVAVGSVALLNRGDDKETQHVNVATDSGNTSTTTNTTPATVIPAAARAIWPFESMNRTFATPEEAAKSFAVDYLGMTKSRLGKVIGDDVEIFVSPTGNARTLVRVEDRGATGWAVLSAMADQILVDQPKAHDALSSSMTVSGTSVAFEAQVGIQLRPFGSTTSVLDDFVMGGSSEMQPFSKQIAVPATDQPLVLILFEGDASGEQTFTKASVIPLDAAGSPEPAQFFAVTNSDELVQLDFAGHVQKTISTQVAQLAYSPRADLLAFTHLGESCRVDFAALSGGNAPAATAGSSPEFNHDRDDLTYVNCDGGVGQGPVNGPFQDLVLPTGFKAVAVAPVGPATIIQNNKNEISINSLQIIAEGSLPASRGRFGTVAFWDGANISSVNPDTKVVAKLVQPAAAPISLDADESGRFLLWVDVNHDLWQWSGGDAVKVGSGFNAAAW